MGKNKNEKEMSEKMKENICEECGKELKKSEKRLCKSCYKILDNILIPILDKNGFTIDVVSLAEPNWYEREENKGKNIYDDDDFDDEDDEDYDDENDEIIDLDLYDDEEIDLDNLKKK